MTVTQRIFWTQLGTSAVAVATCALIFLWLTREVNAVANKKASQQAAATVTHMINRNALLTQDYSYWDSAFGWFQDRDTAALYDNIGSGASDSDSFDLIYLLTPDGTPAFAYVSDVIGSDLQMFEAPIADPFVEPLLAQPLTPYPVVSGVIEIDGEFAVISAARLQPDDLGDLTTDDLPMMIGGTWLDTTALNTALFLDGITLTDTAAPLRPGHSAIPLAGPDGGTVGFLTWPTPQPGRDMLGKAGPIVGFLAVLLLSASAIIGRASAGQTDALLREMVSARTDPVTGLLNRTGIAHVTEQDMVADAIRDGKSAVIYVDLNGLKVLNDTYGHRVGDEAIRVTAERLTRAVGDTGYVARMGGDEFACLILSEDPRTTAADIVDQFQKMTTSQIKIADRTVVAMAAIGVAISSDSPNWEAMLHTADAAMYADKLKKKGAPTDGAPFVPIMG